MLTGVDITSYLASDGSRLGTLVKRILRDVPDLARLRLSSIDCIEADRDLLDVIAEQPRFMPHLHLSVAERLRPDPQAHEAAAWPSRRGCVLP